MAALAVKVTCSNHKIKEWREDELVFQLEYPQVDEIKTIAGRFQYVIKLKGELAQDALERLSLFELELIIKRCCHLYYSLPQYSDFSDQTFDRYIERLRLLQPKHALVSKVTEEASWSGFEKKKHLAFLGSQAKCKNIEELAKWFKKTLRTKELLVQDKLDGISLELIYSPSGKLEAAITRGDGTIGDDITANVLRIPSVATQLNYQQEGRFSVRGEIMMSSQVFKDKFSQEYKNPRNLAAGIARQKDGTNAEYLSFLVYDAFCLESLSTESAKIDWLRKHFKSVVKSRKISSWQDLQLIYEEVKESRFKLDYEIDGLVIKEDIIDLADMQRDRPDRQVAVKFPPSQATTRLKNVVWNVNGTTYTPVAIVEPVQLSGSTVEKASLCNPNIMRELNLRIGSTVIISKRGDIIPKIESVTEQGEGKEIEIPSHCTSCADELRDEGTRLICTNPDCSSLFLHQLNKWIAKLKILSFGEEMIKAVYHSGLVEELADLYQLQVEDVAAMTTAEKRRIGEKNATKALKNLHENKDITLEKFIGGLDIRLVGETMAAKLVAQRFTIRKLRAATVAEIAAIDGFGFIKAEALVNGLAKNSLIIDHLLEHIRIIDLARSPSSQPATSTSLTGLSFCFTGSLSAMNRDQAATAVRGKGASVKTGVSKGLTYLVTNDATSGSAKNNKARELGVKVIDETTFLSLIN